MPTDATPPQEAYDDGCAGWYDSGLADGYNVGFEDGDSDGYLRGYEQGYTDGMAGGPYSPAKHVPGQMTLPGTTQT